MKPQTPGAANEDRDRRGEEPEPSSDSHDPILSRCTTAEELDEAHRHTEQSTKEEDPYQDAEKVLIHDSSFAG
jgi:hypothetical protein